MNYPVSLVQLFEEQVKKNADKVALISIDGSLTYKQLNIQANQLAHYLQARGIERGQVVALSLNRSFNLFVALMAILKAGAAYIPLDPQYPLERLHFMLKDSTASHLITETKLLSNFSEWENRTTCLDAMSFQGYSELDVPITNQATDLAYIIYTSGSTGQPKGVMIEHRSIIDRLYALKNIYRIGINWRHLHYSSYSFDASLEEIFLPLISGAQVVVAPQEVIYDPGLLLQLIDTYEISGINFVPSVLQLFIDEIINTKRPVAKSLECVIAGGETLSSKLVKKFHQVISARLYNTYGPTENTIDSTYYLCETDHIPEIIPIGKPLPNSSVFIFDENMHLATVGEVGELYVGGIGVARGYLNRPDLTSRNFIPSPFNSNEVLYKSGDLAYINPNGDLIFSGRIDNQIKIRGIRIEIDEIINILQAYPKINNVVVWVKTINDDDKIIAYLIKKIHENDQQIIEEIRKYSEKKLPKYMVPFDFIIISELPLTTNGKLDYEALPYPETSKPNGEDVVKNQTAQAIINICQELLNLQSISLSTNFFSIGHSLLAIRFIAKLRDFFEIEIPVRLLFENPILSNLCIKIEAILEKKQKKDPLKFTKVSRESFLPVSYQQQALWFIEQLGDLNNAFDLPAIYDLKGKLRIDLLKEAIIILLNKNEILRTTFIKEAGEIKQVIHKSPKVSLKVHNFSYLPFEDAIEAATQFLIATAKTAYDLINGPLFRFNLLWIAEEHYQLSINVHHIIFDGYSTALMAKELSSIYTHLFYKKEVSLDGALIQYADYAYHYRNYLDKDSHSRELMYWQNSFSGILPLLHLPIDFPRPKVMTLSGKTIHFNFSTQMTNAIYQLARRENCTLYSLILTVFYILLYKYSGQNDIIIGTALSNRIFSEIENLIGFFINTVPIRNQIDNDQTFLETLQKTHRIVLEVIANSDIPFETIVKKLNVQRDTSYNPLFQVMFVLENTVEEKLSFPEIETVTLKTAQHSSKYDLTMHIDERAEYLQGKIEFNLNLFREETIQRMVDHFCCLFEDIISHNDKAIRDLNICTHQELEKIAEFNQTSYFFPKQDYLLHQFFDEQLKYSSEKIAVWSVDHCLTYQQLDLARNSLARALYERQVKPNQLVAILLPKSCDQIIAVLGILKSGAAYLPIAIDQPEKRIQSLLIEAKVHIIITQYAYQSQYTWFDQYQLIFLEEAYNSEITEFLPDKQSNKDLAYVIFTSGSTGTPKGVMIDHSGPVNTILDINHRFKITKNDNIFCLSDLNFDLSVYDIFGGLAAGMTLVLPQDKYAKDPKHWLELFKKIRISIWNSVPALLQVFCDYLLTLPDVSEYKAYLNDLRLILLSGDWISPALPELIRKIVGRPIQIISLGGATEASIWSIYYSIEEINSDLDSIPYGKPLSNQEFYVLNASLLPVPLGIEGELYIGGKGVALGYWQDSKKTERSFIRHPLTHQILYKTGDLGYYLADGNIIFRGRLDNQIKINGMRIEPGEINVKLLEHPGIDKSVITICDDQNKVSYLVAYYILKNGYTFNSTDLKNYMAELLPQYMVPQFYIEINQMPLTSNGKIDLKSLPKLTNTEKKFLAPSTDTEIKLAKIWKNLLQIDVISKDDNFFALGGHSLLAVKLVTMIQNEFNTNVSIRNIFTSSQLFDLSLLIDSFNAVIVEEGVL